MAKKTKDPSNKLWKDIDLNKDFLDGLANAEEVQLDEYNRDAMIIFSANINYARQMLRLSDSLKPVQRRALITMYNNGLKNGTKKKSISVTGAVTEIHPHGGASVYASMIGLGQYWKTPIPLIKIFGAYGSEVKAVFAADRYTEMTMTDYAYNCFFKDYDPDCVQTIFSTSGNRMEPVSLPSRYPNILINGGMGIAVGNAFRIPPFNINEIIKEVKKKLYHDNEDPVYMVPDFPTGCDIVDVDNSVKRICETGKGTLKMRARTEIVDEGKHWGIRVTNLPWGVSQEILKASLVTLTKDGTLPIKDVEDRHEQVVLDDGVTVVSHVDLWVIVDKAHDPYAVREKLFRKTKMEESVAIDFKVVLEDLQLGEFSLSDLIRAWISDRREYKRRILNKRITNVTGEIETLKILIELLDGTNLEKTVGIIRTSPEGQIANNLVSEYGMSSFQAQKIAEMKLRTFNAEAQKRFKKELGEKEEVLERLLKLIRSEKTIDDIIAAELDELKKYAKPRQSNLIELGKQQVIDTETEYFLIATKKGCIKKVSLAAVEKSRKGFGGFDIGDYPTQILRGKNMDSVIFVDSFGKFSVVKFGDIDTLSVNDPPMKAYNLIKLEGEIISMAFFQNNDAMKWLNKNKMGRLYFVTVSKNGFVKKCLASELIEQTEDGCKTTRNAKLTKIKDGDSIAHANYYLDDTNIIVYTRKGEYNYITTEHIPEFGRDAVGNSMMKMDEDDECVGCCVIPKDAEYIVVVTEKGCVKKCEVQFLGIPSGSKSTSYLATLDDGDGVVYVDAPKEMIDVCTKNGHQELHLGEIRTLSRKGKPVKKIAVPQGDNIIRVITH